MSVIKLKRPQPRRRVLRTFQHLAREQHECWYCNRFIEPGEFYQGEVVAYNYGGNKGLSVSKRHVDPECDPPWDDEFEEFVEWAKEQEAMEADCSDKKAA